MLTAYSLPTPWSVSAQVLRTHKCTHHAPKCARLRQKCMHSLVVVSRGRGRLPRVLRNDLHGHMRGAQNRPSTALETDAHRMHIEVASRCSTNRMRMNAQAEQAALNSCIHRILNTSQRIFYAFLRTIQCNAHGGATACLPPGVDAAQVCTKPSKCEQMRHGCTDLNARGCI